MTPPQIVILAGPNGAGKSTFSRLPELEGLPFLNADDIEREQASGPLTAGRTLLARIGELAAGRNDFIIETTLAGKWLVSHLTTLRGMGYQIHITFVWIGNDDLAVMRVASRVRNGGHNIPENVIRRRYKRGMQNFWQLYEALSDTWALYDNSGDSPELVADKQHHQGVIVHEQEAWQAIQEQQHNVPDTE
jgi:predicted ABC-type ATPase